MTDEDGDGAISTQCKGGTDCGDHDFKAHPEPPSIDFQSAPIQGAMAQNTLPYDFNCDGQETAETKVLNCTGSSCNASVLGFQFAVECGKAALLGHCDTLLCAFKAESPPSQKIQRCK